jgi:hypothetical protein
VNEKRLPHHLVIVAGPDRGRELTLPAEGARMGRSEGNDLRLNDPSLSRFHCRFFFNSAGALHLADLASTNDTLVDGRAVQDTELHAGQRVVIGETTLLVVSDRLDGEPRAGDREVDLGLQPRDAVRVTASPRASRRILGFAILLVACVLLAAAGFWVLRWKHPVHAAARAPDPGLEIEYEKVQASARNIFYYSLTLRNGILSVRVENLEDGRQVQREQKVDGRVTVALAAALETSGFFELDEVYEGRAADGWDAMDLTLILNRRARRVRVVNRLEPETFREARQRIEEFGQNEIGLGALSLPPERLLEEAYKAWQAGQNFFQQREVRNDNLAQAIRSFTEVEWYLETVEPKPDYYPAAVAAREEASRRLDEKYEENLFQAERAIRLKDWATANQHLRVCLEILPNRSDERYRKVDRKLMDVQSQMERR